MTIPKVRKRNLWLSSLIFVAALSICASINISNSFANTANFKDLDIALQYKMSEEMAKENPAFHFKKQGQIYEAERFANGLKGTVTPDGVTFTMGTAEWSLALEKVMSSDKTLQFNRTEAMQAVSINKNRLELKNQKITEWFVNGLQGFQQGWTIPKPLSDTQDILTLSFASTGNVTADVMEDKRGINLQDSKGSTVFSYAGLYAFDADGKELPVWFEQKDQSILIQVNDAGAVYPIVVDPIMHHRLTDSVAGAAGDNLGNLVAISADGNTVAAGAPFVNVWGGTAPNAGAIYVFVKDGAAWTQKAKLVPGFLRPDDYSPKSLAINANGTVIVAGVAYVDEDANTECGRIAVFEKAGDGFTDWADDSMNETVIFYLPAGAANSFMGWSVATDASGYTIVVGIPGKDNEKGAVYVYTPAGGGSAIWDNNSQTVPTAILTASDGVAYDAGTGEGGDALGSSVAISPDGLIIAANAPYADVSGISDAGAVYLFEKGAGWQTGPQSKKLTHNGAAENDYLGNQFHGSIGISSKDPFVADPATIAVACTAKKAVYVFTYDSDLDLWNPPSKLTASDNATLENCAITPDGSTILSGARDTKKVYGFKKAGNGNTVWDNGSVDQTMSYSQPLGMDDGSFGYSVGISSDGATVVTGATGATAGVDGDKANAGAVHIFPYTEVVSYTVTYDGNGSDGGSVPTDATAYADGATVTVLGQGTMTKAGAAFAGWHTAADGSSGTDRAPAATFAISANTTLYAKWTCTVTYDGNGKTGGSVPTDGSSPYLIGATVTVLGNTGSLEKTGATFDGWNTLDDGTGTDYAAAATFAISEDTTLYAKWLGNWITDGTPVTWTQGDGSQSTPYLIENAQHLTYLAQQVNAGTTYNGKYFKLNDNIDLTDHYWIPIANVNPRSFQGYFDGNNKTVSNVKIGTALSPITDVGYYGLFGCTGWANAEIKNLTVANVAIYVSAWASIGGLIGDNQGIIDNCSVSGTVGIGTTVFQLNAGGLAGVNGNKIRNSFSTVNIVRSGAANNGRAGGLVGKNYKASTTAGEIENCFATGNVEAGNAAGGLVGWNHADNASLTPTVINSYATGNVLANTYVGGLVGYHYIQNGASILVDTTYWNSDAVQTLNGSAQNPKKGIGDGTGTTTGLTAAQMSSAAGQPSALVDTLNTNKGSTNPTWYSWVQAVGVNNGCPTQSLIAPTTQSTNITFSTVQSTQMQIGWTNGNGGSRAVFVKQADAGTATPVDNTTYTANTAFSSGTQIVATGWYCVYNGTGTSVTVTGLTTGTDYIAQVFEYNGGTGSEKYLTSIAADNPKPQTTTSLPAVATEGETAWSETLPTGTGANKNWYSSAISSDGSKMLVGVYQGRIYLYSNGAWSEIRPNGDIDRFWSSVSMSSDGTKMLAAEYSVGGRLYISTDSGSTWAEAATSEMGQGKTWMFTAISPNGTYMLAGLYGGRLYRSTTSGVSWGEIIPSGNADVNWRAGAISNDGTKILVGKQDVMYLSTDSGGSWTTNPAGLPLTGALWNSISMSADGTKMLVPTAYSPGSSPGKIYLSTNSGGAFNEIQPAGAVTIDWKSSAMSTDGSKMSACVTSGRVYLSVDSGANWTETRPTGLDENKAWQSVSISGDGTKMLAGTSNARIYYRTKPVITTIASTTATAYGNITATNGENASAAGVIYYVYDGTDKIVGTNAAAGSVPAGTGAFSAPLTTLSANTQYSVRAYATNTNGTGYGTRVDFWTLANVPSAPTVNNATATTLDVAVNANSNPVSTTFAIQETSTGNYVQAGGALGAAAVWQTAATWGTKTVTDLTTGTSYTFKVKAKNGGGTETAFGATASGTPVTVPAVAPYSPNTPTWTQTRPNGDSNFDWSAAMSGDGTKMIAGIWNGRLYYNNGTAWSETQPAGAANQFWSTVSISSDGSKMLAGVDGGRLYLYNGGWNETQPGGVNDFNWQSSAMTSDGSKMLAGHTTGLYLYNVGAWTEIFPVAGQNNWLSAAMSSDGSKMLAGMNDGRLYLYSSGSWAETQPAGNSDQNWRSVAINSDGSMMLAASYNARLYLYSNGAWAEIQPAGDANRLWSTVAISGDGSKMLAAENYHGGTANGFIYLYRNGSWAVTEPNGNSLYAWKSASISSDGSKMMAAVYGGRIYNGDSSSITPIAATTATLNGTITATNGANASVRGAIYYPYTCSDKVIGGQDVTNLADNAGNFGIGSFAASATNLTPNTRYNARVYATNPNGTGYGSRVDFWTLANVPSAPTVNNATTTTLDVAVNANSNPVLTEFAIHATATGVDKYVQADGTLGDNAVWQTAATWGTKTVTDLTIGTNYTFQIKAKNGGGTETAFGATASGTPSAVPTVTTEGDFTWSETMPSGSSENKNWTATAQSSDGSKRLAAFDEGRIYLYSSGAWAETKPVGDTDKDWTSVSISSDGSKMLAAVNGGRLYFSTNSGTSWSEANTPDIGVDRPWIVTAMSSDGSKMLAGDRRLYLSTNSGTSWTEIRPNGDADFQWISGSMSSDGSTILAGIVNGKVYLSTNSGASFTETCPTGVCENKMWTSVRMSADGAKMLAAVYNGKIYQTSNTGTSWTEATPAGAVNKTWIAAAISVDGVKRVAAVSGGRVYLSSDSGASWSEVRPTGVNEDKDWQSLSICGAGNKILAGVHSGLIYYGTQSTVTNIAATSATAPGEITATNGANATNRGVIWYPYTNTDKVIGGADVTNVSENGSFGAGAFTASLTGLTPNTRYNARAHATTPDGTGYGSRVDFWTLANVPSAPTVNNATATTLDVTVNVNSNPSTTEFCINETSTGNHVQTNGTLAAGEVWQTAALWGTKTVTGLTTGTAYTFKVKARNGGSTETAYGATASGVPAVLPTVTTQAVSNISTDTSTGNGNITSLGSPNPTQYGVCWNTTGTPTTADSKTEQGAAAATGAFTSSITGLSSSTTYYVRAYATNSAGTAYGDQVSFTTSTPYIPPIIIDPPIITPPTITTDTQVVTSGTATNSGEHEDVTVGAGAAVTNSGTLTDLNNSGTINGGVVAGDSVNDGVMNDVTLPENTALDNAGGTLADADNAGEVFGGTIEGTVTNTGVISGTAPDGTIDASYAVTISETATVSGGEVAGAVINNGVLDSVTIGSNAVISFGGSGQITGSITVIDDEGVACVIAIPSNIVYPDPQSTAQGFVLTPQAIRSYAKEHNWDVKIEERTARLQRNSFAASSTLPQIPSFYYLIDGVVFSETGSKSTQEIEMVVPFNPDNIPDVITASDMIVLVYDYESKTWKNIPHTLDGNNVKIKTDLVSAAAIAAEADLLVSVTTESVSGISHISAASGGSVVSEGGSVITAKGVCWNTASNPTTENNKTDEGTGAGSFKSILTKLSPNTKYYVRAYVTSELGTIYGSEYSFTTAAGLVNSYLTLTDKTLAAFTIPTNANMNMFGVSVGKSIKIKTGARIAFNYFAADNKVVLEESSTQFRVYRSGAAVYLVSILGTVIKIPASLTAQSIYFSDGRADLVIYGSKVMLENQEITLSADKLPTLGNSEKYVDTQISQLPSTVDSYLILTNSSPAFTIPYGAYTQVFGSSGINTISVEKGAKVDCENFVGANVVNIAEAFTAFNVSRRGATVYFESQNGTYIEIPVTTAFQTLSFQDNSYKLAIVDSQIMLIKMVIDEDKSKYDVDDVIVISDSAKR